MQRLATTDKVEYFGNLIRNGYLQGKHIDGSIFDEYIHILNTMSYREIQYLVEYKKYCEETEREPLSRTRLYANLRNKGFGKKIVHGNEYFVGLAEKEEDFLEVNGSQELPFE